MEGSAGATAACSFGMPASFQDSGFVPFSRGSKNRAVGGSRFFEPRLNDIQIEHIFTLS